MKHLIGLLFAITICTSANSQTFNRPAPNATGQYESHRFDTFNHNKYYLMTPSTFTVQGSNTLPNMLYVIDDNGYIAWVYRIQQKTIRL